MKHFVEAQQLDKETISSLFSTADALRSSNQRPLTGKILATLFYEPSTRTRLSFEAAMIRLGGNVISTENAREFSSAVKGESLEDSIRVVATYADVLVLRHHIEGAAKKAAEVSTIPLINAGDGTGQHPTQALLDIYTIQRELGRIDNITVTIIGDLKNGRTSRSLCYLLGKFDNITIHFMSPPHLTIDQNLKDYLNQSKVTFTEVKELDEALKESDIVYLTRMQKERMSRGDHQKSKGTYKINQDNL